MDMVFVAWSIDQALNNKDTFELRYNTLMTSNLIVIGVLKPMVKRQTNGSDKNPKVPDWSTNCCLGSLRGFNELEMSTPIS